MNKLFVLGMIFFLSGLLCGCSETPKESHGLDSRLFGQWQNQQTHEILEFYSDGTYTAEEGETANWSTSEGGKLWMYGTLYYYNLSEDNMVLTLTQDSYTRTYSKI
jgi:hypothetical protein